MSVRSRGAIRAVYSSRSSSNTYREGSPTRSRSRSRKNDRRRGGRRANAPLTGPRLNADGQPRVQTLVTELTQLLRGRGRFDHFAQNELLDGAEQLVRYGFRDIISARRANEEARKYSPDGLRQVDGGFQRNRIVDRSTWPPAGLTPDRIG